VYKAILLSALMFYWSCAFAQVPVTPRSKAAAERIETLLLQKLTEKNLDFGVPIFIRIFKQEAELELWLLSSSGEFELFDTYEICHFSGELGPKQRVGDQQSPEGFYFVTPMRMNPWSRFHLSFNLGYPNVYDRYHGRTGSALMVHGNCVSIGCYAMTDARIEEIYGLAEAALNAEQNYFRVHAFPFRMTEDNMRAHQNNNWFEFWQNLQQGYDWFEKHKVPPNVEHSAGRYIFSEG
jgi:murein L,D-transpeptidase YafK